MKRIYCVLLTLLMVCVLARPARADLLWTPDNRFFERHSDQCTYVGRSYYANGDSGFVTLWDAPGGSGVEAQYENGTKLWVYWLYQDWGCISVWGDEGSVDGWVPMSELELIYDHISFEEAYGSQFRAYGGEFTDYGGTAQGITFWEYPGAPEPNLVWDYDSDILSGLREPNSFSAVFTDEEGLNWGYVAYLYGHRNFWICLDDPTGTDFPVREIPRPELIPAQPPTPPSVSLLPFGLVGAVVLVTAGLLFRLSRTKKKNS